VIGSPISRELMVPSPSPPLRYGLGDVHIMMILGSTMTSGIPVANLNVSPNHQNLPEPRPIGHSK